MNDNLPKFRTTATNLQPVMDFISTPITFKSI